VEVLFFTRFFEEVVKLFHHKNLHRVHLALGIMHSYILSRRGKSIIRKWKSHGVPVIQGFLHILELHSKNQFETFIVCAHYPLFPELPFTTPIGDLVSVLLAVRLCLHYLF